MSHHSAWRNIIQKVRTRLSKWKVKTLSIGGRLTLLKSVLGVVPLYSMSIYKAPKGVLHELEMIRNSFFNGADSAEKKITWVAWDKVLASKKTRGSRAFYGSSIEDHDPKRSSCWSSILREVQTLALKGFDFFRISRFVWGMVLIPDSGVIPGLWIRLFALGFRVQARDGAESQQWDELLSLLDFRSFLDDLFLPSSNMVTRCVKCVPAKVNVSVWRAWLERLPTRDNLVKRGVSIDSNLCPVSGSFPEDEHHLFFSCDLAINIFQKICRWWNLSWMFRRSSSGTLGSLLFGCRVSSNPCWKEF
nr:hypothetical protein [Tanacetum cinerariifolium]